VLGLAGAAQVVHVERWRLRGAEVSYQRVYLVTSLTAAQADAAALLALARAHWGIENRLHYVRDVPLGEDACQVRKGCGALTLVVLRNAVLGVLRTHGRHRIAASVRHFAQKVEEAAALLGLVPVPPK
jgi:predicted transposase YbfD/YdcC